MQNYADLANPKLKGKFCSRSGSHPYNLSLMAAVISHEGEAKAEQWAKGMVANFARAPKGGDTDQIKAVSAGECGVAVSNTYYVARLLRSTKPEDQKMMEKVGIVWPDQNGSGAHINVSGGGMLKTAPNKKAAVKFLEYLASDEAQRYFADGNNEWPAVSGIKISNPGLEAMGKFKPTTCRSRTWRCTRPRRKSCSTAPASSKPLCPCPATPAGGIFARFHGRPWQRAIFIGQPRNRPRCVAAPGIPATDGRNGRQRAGR